MRKLLVYRNGKLAGTLLEENQASYIFTYDELYFRDSSLPPISLTMPKNKKQYSSTYLFPFFYNMTSEGANKKLQSRHLKIDENDHFGLLMNTAQLDTIGPITVKQIAV